MSQNIGEVLERTTKELSEDRMISELSLSPVDGTAAFLLRRVDIPGNRYQTELFRQTGEENPESLGEGPWSSIVWTKSGKLIGVQRKKAEMCLMEISEDAPKEKTIPCAGKLISIDENWDCLVLSRNSINDESTNEKFVYTKEYPIFHNDIGLAANTRAALWYYCAETGEIKRVTEELFSVNQCVADLDCDMIVAVGKEYADVAPYCEEIRTYSVRNGMSNRFLVDQKWSISHVALWDGKIVFAGTDVSLGPQSGTRLMQIDPATKEVVALDAEDISIGNSVISDFRFGTGKSFVAADDGIYAVATRNEQSELWKYSQREGWKVLVQMMETVDMLDVSGDRLVFSGHADHQRTELYEYSDGTIKKRSKFHPPLMGPIPQKFSVTVDGKVIRGFVLPPENLVADRTYPAVLSIHGGPRMAFGWPTGHDHRMLSQGGAFVIYCNPTGSDGRGNEFYDLHGNWGSETKELIAFVEKAVQCYPIDPSRIGVMGGSYGGYMVNCLIAKTNIFAAAVSERSIATLPWQEMLGDLPVPYRVKQFAGGVFEAEEKMWKASPLMYVEKVTTPTLFIQADSDYRCPLIHGASMYQRLVQLGTETRMIVFHKENHGVNRTGKPANRLKRYSEIYMWFRKYLCLN